jgi:hypothetical protein
MKHILIIIIKHKRQRELNTNALNSKTYKTRNIFRFEHIEFKNPLKCKLQQIFILRATSDSVRIIE